ncbi:hypothetical protein CR164_03325 [Prosthecochloris marina]|uniref:Uncharacterized protein n=1 Tax=Prosthecochloris marina TaxID=2017681 RepID=A0A317T7X5_9CHLB|nr:hypothetical protein CR164_03325 [Prosthecochloris marina]
MLMFLSNLYFPNILRNFAMVFEQLQIIIATQPLSHVADGAEKYGGKIGFCGNPSHVVRSGSQPAMVTPVWLC